jgi:tetratricopeptide (TPR) repeat protein
VSTPSAAAGRPSGPAPEDPELARVLEGYLAEAEAGRAPDPERLLAEHPALADRLHACLAGLQLVEEAAPNFPPSGPPSAEAAPRQLGDFRILREVGRGGMGVVYEAEQVSLGRRVALKVLPLAATLDPRRLQRFQNEARAAAGLHHTNIVPVYGVGREQGVSFYAVQLIEGQTLAAVLRELRQAEGQAAGPRQGPGAPSEGPPAEATTAYPPPAGVPAAVSTAPQGALSTEGGVANREYIRAVARLGAQEAEALDYAHQLGVVHRDVKPANLIVDGRGQLWVTDFGLALFRDGEPGLTLTGDLVGTVRYMSPEQALAKRVPIDHRSDVYSLGATLYELLTLQPVFQGQDRQELLRQIAFEEPTPPRRLNKALPAELETVLLKALAKSPAERYATAQELADDLERFLKDEPVRARRPTLLQRARKWARRRRAVVATAAVCLLLALAGLAAGAGWVAHDRANRRDLAEAEAREALREAEHLLQAERWAEGVSAAKRAETALDRAGGSDDLLRQARELRADLEMAGRLEEASLAGTAVKGSAFDWEAEQAAYAQAFRDYGLDVERFDLAGAAERLRARPIRVQLAAALDRLAALRRKAGAGGGERLAALAGAADPDDWRGRVRDALAHGDEVARRQALREQAVRAPVADLPPPTLLLLARGLYSVDAFEQAVALLQQARRHRPADFWINRDLDICLSKVQPPPREEALRYATAAVSLRPLSPGTHVNLGAGLFNMGRLDEAIAEYREALRLKPDFPEAHNNLGRALRDRGRPDEAIAAHNEALRLKNDYPEAYLGLGLALWDKGRLDAAAAAHNEALRLKKDLPWAHNGLGAILCDYRHDYDGAIAHFREAIRLKRDFPEAHFNLGNALRHKGRTDDAIAAYREALRLKPDFPDAHCNLGTALRAKGQLEEAIEEYRHALRIKKDFSAAHNNLGVLLRDHRGDYDGAVAEFREALRLKPDNAEARDNLGSALQLKGLPPVPERETQPTPAGDRLTRARDCLQHKKLYAAAARWYAEAFAAQPELADDLQSHDRYNAACAAALAAAGQGQDAKALPDQERARLRKQALNWLRGELGAWRAQLAQGPDQAGAVGKVMQHWLADADFAGVRGPEALGRLPEAERRRWQRLWEQVEALRKQAEAQPGPAAPAGP